MKLFIYKMTFGTPLLSPPLSSGDISLISLAKPPKMLDNILSQHDKFNPRPFFYQILVLVIQISMVGSQPTNTFNPNNPNNNNDQLQNGKFSAPVAIVIVCLLVALFFMGFFSIYIRQCTATNNHSSTNNNTVLNALAIARLANTNNALPEEVAARGLESSVIETFPMFSYAEVKGHKIGKGALECAVCLNEFGDDETLRLIPKCDHVFHPECIDAWLENHVTCPVCRSDLTPQAGDEPFHPPAELNNRSDDVAVQVDLQEEVIKPEVNQPPRTGSVSVEGRNMVGLQGKFRSHSTGHSLVQPGENLDRFTLKLPHEIRKEVMNRALLNRAKSVAVVLPRNGSGTSIRRWYSTRFGNRSAKGGSGSGNASSFRRIEQPERWRSSKMPPFFSGNSTKVVAEKGEPSTSTILKLPSLRCLEPKTDEMSLMHVEPVQSPA